MTADVNKHVAYAVLAGNSAQVNKHVTYAVLRDNRVGVWTNFFAPEVISGGNSSVEMPLIATEALTGGESVVEMNLFVVEVLFTPGPEDEVIDDILPTRSPIGAPLSIQGLRGLGFSVHKRPIFRTTVNEATSGKETRNARMQYPLYEFELTFEFLDRRYAHSEYDRLAGFFMKQRGSFNEWLYQDPSDYMNDALPIATGDGGTISFTLMKGIGGFLDPIGYLDLKALFTFSNAVVNITDDTITVPNHNLYTGFGPLQLTGTGLPPGLALNTNYWLIKVDENTLAFASSKANAIAGTRVDITSTGSGTFTASNSVAVFLDNVEVPPGDYTVLLPNSIVFAVSPDPGEVISISCKYFFVCRFLEDSADFEEFMEKLWKLDTLEFQSILK